VPGQLFSRDKLFFGVPRRSPVQQAFGEEVAIDEVKSNMTDLLQDDETCEAAAVEEA
jgi:hypothetical protein